MQLKLCCYLLATLHRDLERHSLSLSRCLCLPLHPRRCLQINCTDRVHLGAGLGEGRKGKLSARLSPVLHFPKFRVFSHFQMTSSSSMALHWKPYFVSCCVLLLPRPKTAKGVKQSEHIAASLERGPGLQEKQLS